MFEFYCVTSEHNPVAWDIMDQYGTKYRWGGDLYGALREAARLKAQANANALPDFFGGRGFQKTPKGGWNDA